MRRRGSAPASASVLHTAGRKGAAVDVPSPAELRAGRLTVACDWARLQISQCLQISAATSAWLLTTYSTVQYLHRRDVLRVAHLQYMSTLHPPPIHCNTARDNDMTTQMAAYISYHTPHT
jgi:hypothetical protein